MERRQAEARAKILEQNARNSPEGLLKLFAALQSHEYQTSTILGSNVYYTRLTKSYNTFAFALIDNVVSHTDFLLPFDTILSKDVKLRMSLDLDYNSSDVRLVNCVNLLEDWLAQCALYSPHKSMVWPLNDFSGFYEEGSNGSIIPSTTEQPRYPLEKFKGIYPRNLIADARLSSIRAYVPFDRCEIHAPLDSGANIEQVAKSIWALVNCDSRDPLFAQVVIAHHHHEDRRMRIIFPFTNHKDKIFNLQDYFEYRYGECTEMWKSLRMHNVPEVMIELVATYIKFTIHDLLTSLDL